MFRKYCQCLFNIASTPRPANASDEEPIPYGDDDEFVINRDKPVYVKISLDRITAEDIKENPECTICLEEFKENEIGVFLTCNHVFHEKCIVKWSNRQKSNSTIPDCPNCRKKLQIVKYKK